jgi:hypothetical protein
VQGLLQIGDPLAGIEDAVEFSAQAIAYGLEGLAAMSPIVGTTSRS